MVIKISSEESCVVLWHHAKRGLTGNTAEIGTVSSPLFLIYPPLSYN